MVSASHMFMCNILFLEIPFIHVKLEKQAFFPERPDTGFSGMSQASDQTGVYADVK